MYPNASTESTPFEPRTVRQVTKLLLGAASILLLLFLASLLPGASWLVPGTPITIAALISAVATVAVVGLLIMLAPALATLTQSAVGDDVEVATKAGTVVRIGTVLVAVLVAHRGFDPAVTPLLGDLAWLYDVVFLLLALPLLVGLAIVLYTSLEPTADLFTSRVLGGDTEPTDAGSESERTEAAADGERTVDIDDDTRPE